VIVMFMVMTMSLLGASLVFVSRTETLSSLNYQTVTQSRYAAEAGIAAATNYFLNDYATPTAGGADPIAAYDITQSPVRLLGNNQPVVLSSDPAQSNYPVQAIVDDFADKSEDELTAGHGKTVYSATATLLAMRQMTDSYTGDLITLQTWRIEGKGAADGAAAASVEVSAVLEVNDKAVFSYAAFATANGCGSLSFAGGAHTDSYDSTIANSWNSPTPSGGDVGTNGNLSDNGNAYIDGTLYTPRSGVGNCSGGNITAATAGATISGGVTQLSQPVTFPTPPPPDPLPPTSNDMFSKTSGCGSAAFCTNNAGVGVTIHPTDASTVVTLGNVSVTGGALLHLSAGIYVVNSLSMIGNSTIVVDGPGPIVFKVAGVNQTTAIDFTGGTISNTSFDPAAMQFLYGGTGNVKLTGGADTSGLVVAPNASVSISGGGDFYGAVIAGTVTGTGGAAIHYDRSLQRRFMTEGNPVLHQFTWKNY
jgi:hypothetical protein